VNDVGLGDLARALTLLAPEEVATRARRAARGKAATALWKALFPEG